MNQVLDAVTDHDRRRTLAQLMLCLAKSDGRLCDSESTLLRYALDRWEIELEALAA